MQSTRRTQIEALENAIGPSHICCGHAFLDYGSGCPFCGSQGKAPPYTDYFLEPIPESEKVHSNIIIDLETGTMNLAPN